MKNLVIILLFFSFHAPAQNVKFPKLKISVACNQDFLDHYKGKWLLHDATLKNCPNNNYSVAAMKRMNDIHELVKQAYPEPMGSDANWTGQYVKGYFGYKVKYVTDNGNTQMEYATINPLEGWKYTTVLYPWSCTGNANEISNGYPEISAGNGIAVNANDLSAIYSDFWDDEVWTIEGRPIKRKMTAIGEWKSHDLMAANSGPLSQQNYEFFILISRKNMLPYIPVTRKQYLDIAIVYATKFYDHLISLNDQMQMDKADKEEAKNRHLNAKNSTIKKLQDELAKTNEAGLLEAPAIVRPDPLLMNEGPIFLPESGGGTLLLTENPDYFRKDLPAYVPQLFVLSWSWGTQKWCTDFKKAIEENFPIEKLEALIDK